MGAIMIFVFLISFILFVVGCILLIVGILLIALKKNDKKKVFKLISTVLIVCGAICFFPATCTTKSMISLYLENNEETRDNKGPLLLAIDENDFAKVKKLIESGSDINEGRHFVDKSHTPLSYACYLNKNKMAEFLLQNGADPDRNFNWTKQKNYLSATPFMCAAKNRNYKIMELLLDYGADINKGDERDNPLTIALKYGNLRLVDFIYQNGADNNLEHLPYFKSFIYILVHDNPNIELLNYIYANKIDTDINFRYGAGETPLFIDAIDERNPNEFILRLYELGADISLSDKLNLNALYSAGKNNNFEIVKFLVEKGVSIDQVNYRGETPLFYAAVDFCYDEEIEERIKIIEYLIENGADPKVRDEDGRSIVEYCILGDRSEKYLERLREIIK